jgi:hypothetical protein
LTGLLAASKASDLVESLPPSDTEIEVIRDIAKICIVQQAKPWGSEARTALNIELLVSTLSHALNEDLLVARLQRLNAAEPWVLGVDRLSVIGANEISRWFGLNENYQAKDNPGRLAKLVRANFLHIRTEGPGFIDRLFDPHDNSSLEDACEWLAMFPVFAKDPLQKKSALILQRLYLQGYLPVSKYANLPFAIDRHIVRLFLRLGWIRVRTPLLSRKVSRRQVLSAKEDTALRETARAVMVELAARSGVSNAQLNYTLWQFARTYCARRDPGCLSNQPVLVGLRADLAPDDGSLCLMGKWCSAFGAGNVLETFDPIHRGDLY